MYPCEEPRIVTPNRGGVNVFETLRRRPRADPGMVTVVGVRAVSTPSSTTPNIIHNQKNRKKEHYTIDTHLRGLQFGHRRPDQQREWWNQTG